MWQYTDIDFTSHFGNVTYKSIFTYITLNMINSY